MSDLPSRDLEKNSRIDDRIRNATRGMGSLIGQNIVNSILGFVFLGALLRLLPKVDYGAYSGVQVSIGIASPIALMGLQFAGARYISIKQQGGENWLGAARSILFLSLLTTAVATVVFALLSPSLSLYYMKSAGFIDIFELGSLWLFSNSIATIFQAFVQGLKKYSTLAKILLVSRVTMVAFTVIGLFLFHSVLISIIAWIIYSGIIVVWALNIIGKGFFKSVTKETVVSQRSYYSEIFRYSFPLGVAGVLSLISSYADIVVVGGYLGPISLATYNAAVTVSIILSLVLISPLQTLILPEASSSVGNEKAISNVMRLSFRFIMLVLLPASLLLAGLATQFIFLFSGGGGYLSGSLPLVLIASFYVLDGFQIAVYILLQALGKTTQALIIAAFTGAVDVVFALILVPNFGLIGGALSKDMVAVLGLIVTLYAGKSYLKDLDKFAFYLKSLVPSIAVFVLTYGLSIFVTNRALTLIPYSIGALFVFLVFVKVLRLLSDEDRYFLSHVLPESLQRLVRYI
jgi:O-antigen/teichoic acid export membrane protein